MDNIIMKKKRNFALKNDKDVEDDEDEKFQ